MDTMNIPQGNDKLTIELTVKEAMALASGVRFYEQPGLLAGAKRKVRSQLEQLILPEASKLHYQLIES